MVKVGNDSRRQDFIISEKDQSIFNQNSNPMLIVDSTYNITASNVSFNSFIGKNAKDSGTFIATAIKKVMSMLMKRNRIIGDNSFVLLN